MKHYIVSEEQLLDFEFRTSTKRPPVLSELKRLSDAEIKKLYASAYGTDSGWLGIQGSYFVSGIVSLLDKIGIPK